MRYAMLIYSDQDLILQALRGPPAQLVTGRQLPRALDERAAHLSLLERPPQAGTVV